MLNKKLAVVMILVLLQISCTRSSPPNPIFTKPSPKPPAVVTTKTYQFNPPQSVVIEKKIPIAKPVVVRLRPKPLSSAAAALISMADKHVNAGNLEAAVVNIERALRIEPRNAALTYKLAQLLLKQHKPSLAENIARKSALLAAGDKALKKQSWLLIAEARLLQQNYEGAKAAQLKAISLD